MLVWSQVCAPLAQSWNLCLVTQYWNMSRLNEATNYSCNGNILLGSNGEYDLRPQEHPIVDKHLRFDHFQSFDCGMFHLVWIYHGCPGRTSSCTSSSTGWTYNIPISRLLTTSMSVRSSFLDDVLRNWKKVHRILDEFLIFPLPSRKKCPHVQKTMPMS